MVLICRSVVLFVLLNGLLVSSACGGVVFVNNQTGSDQASGVSSSGIINNGGPVRTLKRAIQIAGKGDVISLANTGVVYHGSIQLTGDRCSGFPGSPFTIEGNGVTISGACPVPSDAWRRVRRNIWEFRPIRKGHYLLLKDGKLLKEQSGLSNFNTGVPETGTWLANRGSIFYNASGVDHPPSQSFSFAAETTGISLFNVRHITIRNLTLKHFRVDGIGAHNLAKNVILENVTCIENGRSGISVAGNSDVEVNGCTVKDNRKTSVRIAGLGAAEVDKSDIVPPPVLID